MAAGGALGQGLHLWEHQKKKKKKNFTSFGQPTRLTTCRCAEVGIRDPALQCKLFDTLVLPILSYGVDLGCEVQLG